MSGFAAADAKGVRAIVSLGSNLEPRRETIEAALKLLGELPRTRLVRTSSIVETEPVDVPDEFRALKFLNCVAILETFLEPLDFSRRMHAIEDALGRVRTVRNGPRTIDIDLIDFGGVRMDTPELTLPHPRAKFRSFVTEPLRELGISPTTLHLSPSPKSSAPPHKAPGTKHKAPSTRHQAPSTRHQAQGTNPPPRP